MKFNFFCIRCSFFLPGKLHYCQWDFWHLTTCGRISVHHMGTNHVVFISECRFCFRIMRFIFRMRFVFQNIALAFLFQNVVCVSECRLFFGIAVAVVCHTLQVASYYKVSNEKVLQDSRTNSISRIRWSL